MSNIAATEEKPATFLGNLILPVVILAMCVVFFFQTFDFPTQEDVGPAAVPYVWMIFTAAFCLHLIVQAALRRGKSDPVPGKIGAVVTFSVWLVIYLMAIESVGYFVSSFVFLIGAMYLMTCRSYVLMGALSSGWLVFSYVVFYKLLYISLPIGPLLRPFLE